jgi:YVTN family beta-propeller protein
MQKVGFLIALVASIAVVSRVHAQPYVYTANADSDNVTVIDAATNTVVTTIAVGSEPRNPAVSPDGTRVYVPNRHDDSVTVINGVTNSVITTIVDDDFEEPYSAAVSPNGARVYVANKFQGGSDMGSLTVINATNNTVLTTINDVCFVSPEWVALNPAGTRAYVVNRQGDSVCIVDTTNNTVLDSVPVGDAPRSAVVTCDGAFVYVANNSGSPSVTKIQTSDNSTSGIDFMNGYPRNMAITPDCSKIYVPLQNDTVGVIATATDAPSVINVPNGDSTYGAAVLFNGTRVYVTDEDDDEVEVIDVATDTVITGPGLPIPTGNTPRGIATGGMVLAIEPVPTASAAVLLVLSAGLIGIGLMRQTRRRRS